MIVPKRELPKRLTSVNARAFPDMTENQPIAYFGEVEGALVLAIICGEEFVGMNCDVNTIEENLMRFLEIVRAHKLKGVETT